MTKREALEKCSAMWHWLAEHPQEDKAAYFEQNEVPMISHDCYCCEYSKMGDLHECPLSKLWGTCRGAGTAPCITNTESPYILWYTSGGDEIMSSESARAIAEAADRELAKLPKSHD